MQTEAVLRSHSNNPIGKRYNDAYALLEKPVPQQQDRPQPVHLVVAAARGPRSLVADQSTEPPRNAETTPTRSSGIASRTT